MTIEGNNFPLEIKIRIDNKDQLREMYWRFLNDFRFLYEEKGYSSEGIDFDLKFGMFVYLKLYEKTKQMKIHPLMERKGD